MTERFYQIQYKDTTPGGSNTWVRREGAEFPWPVNSSWHDARDKALKELAYLRERFSHTGEFRLVVISTDVLDWA